MRRAPQLPTTTVQFHLALPVLKELLRDLLFREAGQPYFKRLAVPHRRRWFGLWRTLSTYQAERQLLPVGGRDTNRLIQEFFQTHVTLRAEFQQGGMPVTAIRVLRQYCLPLDETLARVHTLECAYDVSAEYRVAVVGGATPPGWQPPQQTADEVC